MTAHADKMATTLATANPVHAAAVPFGAAVSIAARIVPAARNGGTAR